MSPAMIQMHAPLILAYPTILPEITRAATQLSLVQLLMLATPLHAVPKRDARIQRKIAMIQTRAPPTPAAAVPASTLPSLAPTPLFATQ